MSKKPLFMLMTAALATTCTAEAQNNSGSAGKNAGDNLTLADFQARGAKFKNVLSLPQFETTPEAIKSTADKTIAEGNALLDTVGKLPAGAVNFDNTLGALDRLGHLVGNTMNRINLIKETSPSEAVRDAATEAVKKLQEWAVGLDYREDVYRAVK